MEATQLGRAELHQRVLEAQNDLDTALADARSDPEVRKQIPAFRSALTDAEHTLADFDAAERGDAARRAEQEREKSRLLRESALRKMEQLTEECLQLTAELEQAAWLFGDLTVRIQARQGQMSDAARSLIRDQLRHDQKKLLDGLALFDRHVAVLGDAHVAGILSAAGLAHLVGWREPVVRLRDTLSGRFKVLLEFTRQTLGLTRTEVTPLSGGV